MRLLAALERQVMARSLMPRRFESCVTVMPATPDGCAELVVEVNGSFVSSTVLGHADMTHADGWLAALEAWWHAEILRRC